jgi:uncharacterized protein (TIGR00730 family)
MNVTIFGGADPREGDAAYEEARLLGQLLAREGHTVVTGGYIGTMEAVSRGAAEVGGRVVGVTCRQVERWRGVRANPWVAEEWPAETLMERLWRLVDRSDAAIALPGGIGTLAEIAFLWNLVLIKALPPCPLIVVGDGWRRTLDAFFEGLGSYVPGPSRALVTYASGAREAAGEISNRRQPRDGGV